MIKLENIINEEVMWEILVGVLNSLPELFHSVTTTTFVLLAIMGIGWKIANDLIALFIVWAFKQCLYVFKMLYLTISFAINARKRRYGYNYYK